MTVQMNLNCMDVIGPDYQPQILLVADKNFEGVRIPVDNHQYSNCHFQNCVFLYSGGPFAFFDCSLEGEGGHLNLTGHADRVLRLLNLFRNYATSLKGPY
jgi:hypothetical protein